MSEALLTALEDERRYMARELHDGVAQTTLQLGLQAGICSKLLERGDLEMLADELAELEKRIRLASSQVRELIADMRPPQLDPQASLNEYIEQAIETHLERGGPPIEVQAQLAGQSPQLTVQQRLTLFRIIQEALLNVRKHAEAQNVRLTLSGDEAGLQVTIADNGQGFDPTEVEARPVDKGGAGLTNLRARAQALGGSLSISRDSTGGWTVVKAKLPHQAH